MAKYITFGKYNKINKYICLYIILRLIFEYLFGNNFEKEIRLLNTDNLPKSILIQDGFNYLFIFIFSKIFLKYFNYESQQTKKDFDEGSEKNKLIYNEFENNVSEITIILIIFSLILSDQLDNTFFNLNLKGLNYWMLEIIFICIFTSKIFKVPIYKHKKFSLIFIVIFCSIMKILSIVFRMFDSHKKRIYQEITWIIPIAIISYILITLQRAYSYCKTKWLFELKFISPLKLLTLYGFFGAIFCFILSIIPTLIPCNKSFSQIELICTLTTKDTLNDSTIYYYENYIIYFKHLWNDEKIYINIIYLFLFVLKIFLCFLIKLYLMLIIYNLSPEYLICSNCLLYFIIELADFILFVIKIKKEESSFRIYKFFGSLNQFICLLGCIIYLEIIELNFCGLNNNLKKNIMERSMEEINAIKLYEENEKDDEDEDNND